MKDRAPRMEALPGAFVELLRLSKKKVNKPTPSMSPWAALDENEYEGPSVGRAKVHLLLSNRN